MRRSALRDKRYFYLQPIDKVMNPGRTPKSASSRNYGGNPCNAGSCNRRHCLRLLTRLYFPLTCERCDSLLYHVDKSLDVKHPRYAKNNHRLGLHDHRLESCHLVRRLFLVLSLRSADIDAIQIDVDPGAHFPGLESRGCI